MNIPEPIIEKGKEPEQHLQVAVVSSINRLLSRKNFSYRVLENFGLDIACFFQTKSEKYIKFIEIKSFVGSRQGGVGFGNNKGIGSQVDLLLSSPSERIFIDDSVRWILGNGLIEIGNPRYVIFSLNEAEEAAMGGVRRGKQNNLRVSYFKDKYISWTDLLIELETFLLEYRPK